MNDTHNNNSSMQPQSFVLSSLSDWDRVVESCIAQGSKKIALSGVIGAGKSTFIRRYCQILGVDPDQVTSPTYTRYNTYQCDTGTVVHCDMRRAESQEQLITSGTLDAFNDAEYIFVERPKRKSLYIDSEWTEVDITYDAGCSRTVIIRSSASA